MQVTGITANLLTDDMAATLTFYEEVLGFQRVSQVPDEAPFVWAMLQAGDASVMFQTRESLADEYPALLESPTGTGLTLFVTIDDVKAMRERVEGKAELSKDLHRTFYGMEEFALCDPNGLIITFAQRVATEESP